MPELNYCHENGAVVTYFFILPVLKNIIKSGHLSARETVVALVLSYELIDVNHKISLFKFPSLYSV